MLNRRILRIKAMQSLYGYYLIKTSLQKAIGDNLSQKYELDPAVHDFSDKKAIEARQREIVKAFDERVKGSNTKFDFDTEVLEEIEKAANSYHSQLSQEESRLKKYIVRETEDIYRTFLKILRIPVIFLNFDRKDQENKKQSWRYNLSKNSCIQVLSNHEIIKDADVKPELNWSPEDLKKIKGWYRDIVSSSQDFVDYQNIESPSTEEDLEITKHLFKQIIFKAEAIESDFVASDLHWSENKSILKNLVLKSLKTFDGESIEIKALSQNKDEDFDFFNRLFKETLNQNDQWEEYIKEYARNWDLERIANIDMIIMKMAIAEMICFPSIPVKVTINEYIDISKMYSTPRSKQFVNGILDVISNKLSSEGVIKKSGRGLIDNK